MHMGRLSGKVAVVTGGANGIGRACCERFAEEGADVVLSDVGDEAGAATAEALERQGVRSRFVHADASSASDAEAVMEAAVELGGIDVLVTAAGISHADYESGNVESELQRLAERGADPDRARQLVDMPLEAWQRVLDVNLTGTFLAVQAAARRMLDQGRGGSIVTIASVAAKHPDAGPLAYTVSKSGVWMLTKHAARSLGPAGIRVNAVGPGFIDTNMTAIIREVPGVVELVLANLPLRRIGLPREVADAVLFLASEESSYFTGEILHPDGGYFTE
jgi:NAD(P)-dependent dehydrogenase (short-subunit alcohol dehydrogenase family)